MSNIGVKFVSTTQAGLESLDVVDGQLIFVTDSSNIYVDFNRERTLYTKETRDEIVILENDAARTGLESPIEAFYYITETSMLWRYSGGEWVEVSSSADIELLSEEDISKITI